jgi:hypothetical protein
VRAGGAGGHAQVSVSDLGVTEYSTVNSVRAGGAGGQWTRPPVSVSDLGVTEYSTVNSVRAGGAGGHAHPSAFQT